jgi:hypothetical protein
MKRLAIALLAAPVLALAACQDNDGTEREIAQLKLDLAQLRDAQQPPQQHGSARAPDTRVDDLQLQLDRMEGELAEARKRITELETRPANAAPVEAAKPQADPDAEYKKFLELDTRRRMEQEEERRKREAERNAEWARIAKENGIDFDPGDVQGSIRKIMRDPVQMQKAMTAMRKEADKRRFANTGLDEQQIERVKKIEGDTRDKIAQAVREGRQNGTPTDEVTRQVEQIGKDQETELKTVMTEDQYKKYMENGGPAAGAIPDLGDLIPGWGGRRER